MMVVDVVVYMLIMLELFGCVIVEGMFVCWLVVVVWVGGVVEIIEDGDNGLFCELGNVVVLVDVLVMFKCDCVLCEWFVVSGCVIVVCWFGIEIYVEWVEKIFVDMVKVVKVVNVKK